MADQISFALVLDKNLKLENLKLKQIETVINVRGDTDPVTLQRMRDAVRDSFQDRRKNLNALIAKSEGNLAKIKNRKDRQKAAKVALQAIDKQVKGFEKNLNTRIVAFCREEEKKTAEFDAAQVKWGIATMWSAGAVLKDTVTGIAALFASAALPPASLALGKAIADLALDMKGLYQDLRDACKSEADVRKDISNAFKKLKAIKKPKPVPKSSVNQLDKSIQLHKAKLDEIEMRAKQIGARLNGFLKLSEKPGLSKNGKKILRGAIDKRIKEIVKLNTDLKKGRSQYTSFLSKYKQAKKRQATDAWSIVDWSLEVYDVVNKLFSWTVEFGDVEKQMDMLVTLSTKDDFFEPVGG
jgi:chromosome segregation ATPase